MPVLKLTDTSMNNPHPIDWAAYVASATTDTAVGSIIKLTEGGGYVSDGALTDWSAAKQYNLPRAFYHFARPEWNHAVPGSEANWFLAHLPQLDTGDVLCLDIETPIDNSMAGFDFSGWALAWLEQVEKATGVTPLLYTYPYYALTNLTNPALARFPLWLAAYQAVCPPRLGVWETVTLWQYTASATIPGITGLVDDSVYFPGPAAFRQLGKGHPAPTPPPTPRQHAWTYRVTTETHARAQPAKDAPWASMHDFRVGDLAHGTGTMTGHWRECYLPDKPGRAGWLYAPDLLAI